MMGGQYGFGGFAGMAWMPFVGIFFWLLVVVLIIAAVRTFVGPIHHRPEAERPSGRAILDERYARGEISREEYLQKRQDMTGRTEQA